MYIYIYICVCVCVCAVVWSVQCGIKYGFSSWHWRKQVLMTTYDGDYLKLVTEFISQVKSKVEIDMCTLAVELCCVVLCCHFPPHPQSQC